MDSSFKIPFYAKMALIAVSLFAFFYMLSAGERILLPILYATVLAILLNPLVNFLMRKGVNKIVAISLAVAFSLLAFFLIGMVISSQVSMLSDTYPQLVLKIGRTSTELVHWVSEKFHTREDRINDWIKKAQSEAISNLALGEKLTAVGQALLDGMLVPVYLFMILFYKPLLLDFIRRLFRAEHHTTVAEVLVGSKRIIESYLVGLFFEMVIVAVLNSAGLLLLGIDYAIILGITGAILNIIPYIGGIIAIALPMIIAFVTKDSVSYAVLVLGVYLIIQFIDNHYLIPKIVASRVQINALVSVIVVLIGGALWGVPGMFLSIPLTAIIKVIFDHIETMKPWGFLLGNIVPTASRFSFIRMKNPK